MISLTPKLELLFYSLSIFHQNRINHNKPCGMTFRLPDSLSLWQNKFIFECQPCYTKHSVIPCLVKVTGGNDWLNKLTINKWYPARERAPRNIVSTEELHIFYCWRMHGWRVYNLVKNVYHTGRILEFTLLRWTNRQDLIRLITSKQIKYLLIYTSMWHHFNCK